MKKYMKTIFILGILLLIFPFLALPQLWESLYVVIIGFIICYRSLRFSYRNKDLSEDTSENENLRKFAKRMQKKIVDAKNASDLPEERKTKAKISSIKTHNE